MKTPTERPTLPRIEVCGGCGRDVVRIRPDGQGLAFGEAVYSHPGLPTCPGRPKVAAAEREAAA